MDQHEDQCCTTGHDTVKQHETTETEPSDGDIILKWAIARFKEAVQTMPANSLLSRVVEFN